MAWRIYNILYFTDFKCTMILNVPAIIGLYYVYNYLGPDFTDTLNTKYCCEM